MAFDLNDALGYGNGTAGDFTAPAGNTVVNSYAEVVSLTSTTVTIRNPSTVSYGGFAVNMHVLLHIIDVDSDSYRMKIGGWRVLKIKAVDGNTLTVGGKPTKLISGSQSHCRMQLITIPQFQNVTVNSGCSIVPAPYANGKGGVVAFKCAGTLALNGGHIDLSNAGLNNAGNYKGPDGSTTHRRLLAQEAEEVGTTYDSCATCSVVKSYCA